ncbi:MAG: diacylglycerol kinase family protein [Methylococcaceae bacterium]|nr:diacylglycerol kinase family protein [Methylococcaceae bacterium]
MSKQLEFAGRLNSFKYAFNGITVLLKSQPNARLHGVATLIACTAGIGFGITPLEWSLIVLVMAAVWVAEALNTAIELLADATHPEHHPLIGQAKDVAAGAVLIAAISSMIVGVLVFWPYCLQAVGKR